MSEVSKTKKIKDLPKDKNLENIKVRDFNGFEGYWVSQWEKGVWLRKEKEETRIYPIFVEDLSECLEWEVIEE